MQHNARGSSAPSPDVPSLYADVIIPRHIAKAFTYLVPAGLRETLGIGHGVLVPFGQAMLEAAVVSMSAQPPAGVNVHRLKEIHSLIHRSTANSSSQALFELSRKVAEYYVAPWGQCLRLIFPSHKSESGGAIRYMATDDGRAALKSGNCPLPLRPLLERIARRSAGISSSTLHVPRVPNSRQTLADLQGRSWITGVPSLTDQPGKMKSGKRLPLTPPGHGAIPALPKPDPLAVDRIVAAMQGMASTRLVIHAHWATRLSVLARAIQMAQSLGKSVIVITGEVAKAQWLRERLSVITKLPIRESPSVDPDGPQRLPVIVVGPRSAVFSAVPATGLIWVDEEDDAALKELQEPRYHAREVACMRGEIERAVVVLASSHPSLEAYADPSAERFRIDEQVAGRPPVQVVDLRMVPRSSPFSAEVISAMQEAVARKAGVLLFLNKKGYAGALVCGECGWIPRCAACAVAYPYSRETTALCCRYCGSVASLPDSCPTCHASRLSPVGEGTERIEVEARRLFPTARTARFDGDTLRRPDAARALWENLRAGEWDIVIGTQALFQREPLPKMGMIGIIQADSGLHVADFRAAEHMYHLLVDAVSVARPASEGGRVILQTWLPGHHAVAAIVSGDPARFYDEEGAARRLLGYPPANHLASLSVAGKDRRLVGEAAHRWKLELERFMTGQATLVMLGPVTAMAGRTRGLYRDHILLKADDCTHLSSAVRTSVACLEEEYRKARLKFIVDVDPVDMF